MRCAALVLALCALSSCTPKPSVVGPFVRSVAVENGALVVEKCMVQLHRDQLSAERCVVERTPLQSAPAVSDRGPDAPR